MHVPVLFISCKHDVTENKKNFSDETVTSKPQNNFLYFGRRGFGVSGVWKDVLDFFLVCQSAMVSRTRLSQVPDAGQHTIWILWRRLEQFVGPLILGQKTKSIW